MEVAPKAFPAEEVEAMFWAETAASLGKVEMEIVAEIVVAFLDLSDLGALEDFDDLEDFEDLEDLDDLEDFDDFPSHALLPLPPCNLWLFEDLLDFNGYVGDGDVDGDCEVDGL